jgi:hypothetical protein
MSIAAMILGHSGSGKSRSMLNLNPASTYVIQVIDKPLPFKGWKSKYSKESKNLKVTDNAHAIISIVQNISTQAPHINCIVIDDTQYVMANEFMRRCYEKSFEKFSEIARNMWDILTACANLREDLVVFLLSHTEENDTGTTKMKTIGKLLDDKITCEGMVSIVLRTFCQDGKYGFYTQNNGRDTVKSPEGMFSSATIDNDLELVRKAIVEYNS